MKSKVKLQGNKKEGWIITISDNIGFKEDMPITHEELEMLKKLIDKKV